MRRRNDVGDPGRTWLVAMTGAPFRLENTLNSDSGCSPVRFRASTSGCSGPPST